MAMRDLVERECGGSNPLMKVASHFTQDKAYKQEIGHAQSRIGIGGSGVVSRPLLGTPQNELVDEFLLEQYGHMQGVPQSFHMGRLLQEMHDIEQMHQAPIPGPGVAVLTAEQWAEEYKRDASEKGDAANPYRAQPMTWAKEYFDEKLSVSPNEKWAEDYLQDNAAGSFDSFWAEESNQKGNNQLAKTAKELMESVDDPDISNSEFMKFVKKIADGDVALEDKSEVVSSSDKIADVWSQEFAEKQTTEGIWTEEFDAMDAGVKREQHSQDNDFWDKLQKEWEQMAKDEADENPWLSDFESVSDPLKEYRYAEDNPLRDHPDAFQEGLKKLEEGDLPSAVLLFEAAVQQEPGSEKAWQYLGTSQAQNENDQAAISALRRALDLDAENLTALMALAVSYTNESLQAQACHALLEWVRKNPKYRQLVPDTAPTASPRPGVTSLMSSGLHTQVCDVYLNAARLSPTEIDADVQCGLGVLFNLSGDYDRAVDCFTAAVQAHPRDSQLWNKLGATLANGNRSEEAIEAYHTALQIYPGFVRSRYNLGISCINLKAYREAAEHFLAALNLQAAGKGPLGSSSSYSAMSETIWATMNGLMTLMDRPDLLTAVGARDLSVLNKEFSMEV